MATSRTRRKGRSEVTAESLEKMSPCERMGHEIVGEHRDLTPSVDRIMTSELSDEERLRAMTMFRSSLGTIGDPNRDPRVAIVACRTAP